jgi:acyclic terpene utilization AtuA family protein
VDWMLSVVREVFDELHVTDAKVAVIRSEIDPVVIINEFKKDALKPTGLGPDLSEENLRESTIVGQMGIHPLITALESGAQYVLAGRSGDIALFASDMIRRGIDPGLAYHVGHVLECGALACDPGSPSDCLIAEIYDDGTALFVAPNEERSCTPYSIAAHLLVIDTST